MLKNPSDSAGTSHRGDAGNDVKDVRESGQPCVARQGHKGLTATQGSIVYVERLRVVREERRDRGLKFFRRGEVEQMPAARHADDARAGDARGEQFRRLALKFIAFADQDERRHADRLEPGIAGCGGPFINWRGMVHMRSFSVTIWRTSGCAAGGAANTGVASSTSVTFL